jgi:hypothetical protein
MEDKSSKQANFHDPYQNIGSHKMGCPVKVFFTMGEKNIGIYIAMNQKKYDQENTGEGHGNFLTNSRGE